MTLRELLQEHVEWMVNTKVNNTYVKLQLHQVEALIKLLQTIAPTQ